MSKGLKADRIWGTRQEAMLAISVVTAAGTSEEQGAVAVVALMFNSAETTIQQGVDTQRAIQQLTAQRKAAVVVAPLAQQAADAIASASPADVEKLAAALAAAVDSKLSGEGVEWVGDARSV